MKILIVEDNPDGREIVVLYVKSLGYEVFEAATGIEALDQARAVHPDLILMDLVLPEMPGHEVTARLKADPSTREIPVIVLTALSRGSQSVESVIAAGAAKHCLSRSLLNLLARRCAAIYLRRTSPTLD